MSPGRPRWQAVGPALAYLALTLVLTRPGLARFNTHLMADGADGVQQAWILWWIKTALMRGEWPWWTDRLFAPEGAPLYFHPMNLPLGLLSIPLQLLGSLTVAHNVVVIVTFVLSGWIAYRLARYCGAGRDAAFLAGLVFTFCPFHFAHGIGHLQLMPMFWLPLYVWMLLRACRSGLLRQALLAGVVLFAVVVTDYYYALYCGMAAVLVAAWQRRWAPAAVSLAVAGAFSLPLAGPMVRLLLSAPFWGEHDPVAYSADVVGWVVPGEISAWAALSRPIWSRFTGNAGENGMYLGVVPLGILIASLCLRSRKILPFVLGGSIFAVLALGPWLHVAGHVTRVPMPYLALATIPPFNLLGPVPGRFMAMAYLGLALAVGMALTELWRNAARGQRRVLFLAAMTAILLDFFPQPYTTTPIEVPPFYAQLAREGDRDDIVLDLPPEEGWYFPTALMYQTFHDRRLVGGHLARVPMATMEAYFAHPLLRLLHDSLPCGHALRSNIEQRLKREHVRWIVARRPVDVQKLRDCLKLHGVAWEGLVVFTPLNMATIAPPAPSEPAYDPNPASDRATTITPPAPVRYYAVTPCRAVDTRPTQAPLAANSTRTFTVGGTCGVPADARVVAANLVAVNPGQGGNLRVYPYGFPVPLASSLNFAAGRTRANNAVAALGAGGQIHVRCDMPPGSTASTHFVLDVVGYFR